MTVLLVTYDLDRERSSQDYESILKVIKREKNWARLSESSYAVKTDRTPRALYEELEQFLDEGDKLLVFTLTKPYYGRHAPKIIDWLAPKL
jgi:hypothetical protein